MDSFVPIAILAVVVIVFLLTHKSIVADLKAKGSADLAALTSSHGAVTQSLSSAISSLGSSHATAITAIAAQPIAAPAPVIVNPMPQSAAVTAAVAAAATPTFVVPAGCSPFGPTGKPTGYMDGQGHPFYFSADGTSVSQTPPG